MEQIFSLLFSFKDNQVKSSVLSLRNLPISSKDIKFAVIKVVYIFNLFWIIIAVFYIFNLLWIIIKSWRVHKT